MHIFKTVIHFAILGFVANLNSQIINTQFGPVEGKTVGSIQSFLGIPFAKPPVGALRWQAPQNPDAWVSILQAKSFAPACAQISFNQGDTTSTIKGSEDCLYLNVWKPQNTTNKLPVMFFIHGGGNQQGSAGGEDGGTVLYDGTNLSQRGNVIVVTIQYRLGPFGFLAHKGLEKNGKKAGNYAVMDQLLALNWVKNNISRFGGDSANVTVFGESAGALNTGNLLLTAKATGLMHKAIIQSGVALVVPYQNALDSSSVFVNKYISSGTDSQKIAFMRTVSAYDLVKDLKSPTEGGKVGGIWRPCVDNDIFTGLPMDLIKAGSFNKIPLMIGTNADEMSLSSPKTITPAMVSLLINTLPAASRAEANTLYPPSSTNTQARVSYVNLLSDAQFHSTTRRMAQCVAANQSLPVWRYYFTYKHSVAALQSFGSYHGMELFYVFNNWENATLGKGVLFKAQDDSMQKVCLQYWTNFAKTGDPNGAVYSNWPQYKAAPECYMDLKATPDGSKCQVIKERCDFWDKMTFHTPCKDMAYSAIKGSTTIKVFPNPSNGKLYVEGNEKSIPQVYTLEGRLVESAWHNGELQLIAPNGLYILKVDGANSSNSVLIQVNK